MANITTWSVSRLNVYERCPHQAKLAFIDKLPQPTSEAMARGIDAHEKLERYIRGEGTALPVGNHDNSAEAMNIRYPDLDKFRDLYPTGYIHVEEEWGFRRDWTPCEYHAPDVWARIKLDVLHRDVENKRFHIVDWKTGRKKGNEIHHSTQGTIYAIATYKRFSEFNEALISFNYIDAKSGYDRPMGRSRAELFIPKLEARISTMCNDTEFRPIPSQWTCKYCPFGAEQGGQCGYSYIG